MVSPAPTAIVPPFAVSVMLRAAFKAKLVDGASIPALNVMSLLTFPRLLSADMLNVPLLIMMLRLWLKLNLRLLKWW